jgi:hypothetical protein
VKVCVKTLMNLGRKYRWQRPERCPKCGGVRVSGRGFVAAYFDQPGSQSVFLKRYRCPQCRLEATGIEVHAQAQDVFTIVGRCQQLKDLANRPSCRRLRTPRKLFLVVEEASRWHAEPANLNRAVRSVVTP